MDLNPSIYAGGSRWAGCREPHTFRIPNCMPHPKQALSAWVMSATSRLGAHIHRMPSITTRTPITWSSPVSSLHYYNLQPPHPLLLLVEMH